MAEERPDALEWFVREMRLGHIRYRNGKLWRMWDVRYGWLARPRRAEKPEDSGYLSLRVKRQGEEMYVGAHRVIWSYFNGPIPPGMEINHINGVTHDNRLENLELTTKSGNMRHAFDAGLARARRGLEHDRTKLSNEDVRCIRRLVARGVSQASLARHFRVGADQISRIVRRERRQWVD